MEYPFKLEKSLHTLNIKKSQVRWKQYEQFTE